jgi:hypothetical protein
MSDEGRAEICRQKHLFGRENAVYLVKTTVLINPSVAVQNISIHQPIRPTPNPAAPNV